jgi:hypothetical protein
MGYGMMAKHRAEEEHALTHYSDSDLNSDPEFKIVRSMWGGEFSKPDTIYKVIEQEQEAGWTLVEKLDNSRLRFERPRSAQTVDSELLAAGIDPYRTVYNSYGDVRPEFWLGLLILISFIGGIGLIILVQILKNVFYIF